MIILIYKTDNWHSYKSRDLIAICDNNQNWLNLCKKQAEKENVKLTEDDIYNLVHINQTQGYKGEGEFVIESVKMNKLL